MRPLSQINLLSMPGGVGEGKCVCEGTFGQAMSLVPTSRFQKRYYLVFTCVGHIYYLFIFRKIFYLLFTYLAALSLICGRQNL